MHDSGPRDEGLAGKGKVDECQLTHRQGMIRRDFKNVLAQSAGSAQKILATAE